MKIEFSDKKLKDIKADLELVLVVAKDLRHRWIHDIDLLNKINYTGKDAEMVLFPEHDRLYYGVNSMGHEDLRIACAEIVKSILFKHYKTIKIGTYFEKNQHEGLKALSEGLGLGHYTFDKYKTKPGKKYLTKAVISAEDYRFRKIDVKSAKQSLRDAEAIVRNVNIVRDMVNMTPEEVNPLTMSGFAKKIAKDNPEIKVNVYGEKYIREKKMGAFLAVSKASPYPPQLIHLSYKPKNPKRKITLVGKGLTFDTGGLSLKPSEAMLTMKMDKAGGCAIFGIMQAVAQLRLPIEVHGIVGAVENAIGKHAYKPDDVLTAKNGKTIEVKNTDAEGRLVLADCLCYAQDLKPDYIIDIATLTGACIVALGEYTIGVMGHDERLKNEIRESGERSGELTGLLPFNRYLPKLLESKVADISNVSGGKWGGAITAGLFLSEFIKEEYKNKWIHLDIAGPAFNTSAWGENPAGASGAGVRLILDWLIKEARNK